MKLAKWLGVVCVLAALSACSTAPDNTVPVEDRDGSGASSEGAQSEGMNGSETNANAGAESSGLGGITNFTPQMLEDPASPLSERVIYFEFDSSEIKTEYQQILIAHGTFLAQNPGYQISVEGHTDERGSREYNIGLGERRAKAAVQIMLLQGAAENQIKWISYGEEKLANTAHDDSAQAQNRRAVLVYNQ